MVIYILALLVLSVLAARWLYVRIGAERLVRNQFDDLMPQRMVDYSGFVEISRPQG